MAGHLDILHRLAVDVQELLRALHQTLPLGGQMLLPVEGVKQLHAQLLLQLLDCDGQRGLGDGKTLRGAGEAALLYNGHKIGDLFDIHRNAFLPVLVCHFVSS